MGKKLFLSLGFALAFFGSGNSFAQHFVTTVSPQSPAGIQLPPGYKTPSGGSYVPLPPGDNHTLKQGRRRDGKLHIVRGPASGPYHPVVAIPDPSGNLRGLAGARSAVTANGVPATVIIGEARTLRSEAQRDLERIAQRIAGSAAPRPPAQGSGKQDRAYHARPGGGGGIGGGGGAIDKGRVPNHEEKRRNLLR